MSRRSPGSLRLAALLMSRRGRGSLGLAALSVGAAAIACVTAPSPAPCPSPAASEPDPDPDPDALLPSCEPSEDPGPDGDPKWLGLEALRGPGCVAWAPSTGHFACIGLEAIPTDGDAYDLSTPGMDDTLAAAIAAKASITLAVVDVEPEPDPDSWGSPPLVALDPSLPPPAAARELAGVRAIFASRGLTEPLDGVLALELDEDALNMSWEASLERAYAPLGLSFVWSCELYEGDASFEYSCVLAVRCAEGAEPKVIFDDLGGPFGRLGFVEGGPRVALSVEHLDGGEGYVDVNWRHYSFALAGLCPGSGVTSAGG